MNLRCAAATTLFLCSSLFGVEQKEVVGRVHQASSVLTEILSTPDRGIAHDLLESAHCAVIVPGLEKVAFVTNKYGKGFLICRTANGWSAPAAIRIEGNSIGFDGVETIDLVMLVMNEEGRKKLLASKFTLGLDSTVAAGPVGPSAAVQTDAKQAAGVLTWSRAKGAFAGIALQGATLRPDTDDNQALYGRQIENAEIVTTHIAVPSGAQGLTMLLNHYSSYEKK